MNPNNYYQPTLEEYIEVGPTKPTKDDSMKLHTGNILYFCKHCGKAVGMYSTGSVHPVGWFTRRETCSFGHKIDWSDEPDE